MFPAAFSKQPQSYTIVPPRALGKCNVLVPMLDGLNKAECQLVRCLIEGILVVKELSFPEE